MIVNPRAGRGGALAAKVRTHLDHAGCHVEEWPAGTAEELAAHVAGAEQAEIDAVIVAGGDGTLRTALQAQRPQGPPVALLPCGTANVIARDIGLPRDARALARICRHGPARPVHGGYANDALFLMSAGIGFDAHVVGAVDPALKRRIGRLAYLAAAIGQWRRWPPARRYGVSDGDNDDDRSAEEAAAVIVLNTRLYGGGFTIDPGGGIEKPGLLAILFRGGRRRDILRYALAGAMGRLHRLEDVSFRRCSAIRIAAGEEERCQIDGDPGPALPLTVTAAAGIGRLILPG